MNTSERRKAIYELVKEKGFVSTGELKDQFHVSEVTIRNDLDTLAMVGTIHRVFGGAVYSEIEVGVTFKNEIPTFGENREKALSRNKHANMDIAKIAVSLIGDDVIFLDDSDVSELIAKELAESNKTPMVFTNSLRVFEPLKHSRHLKALLIGGEYDQKTECFMGELTQIFVEKIKISKVFIAARGFDIGFGVEVHPCSDLHLKKTLAENAESILITAEDSCFSHHGTIGFFPWYRIHSIITNRLPPEEYVRAIRSTSIQLIYDTQILKQ